MDQTPPGVNNSHAETPDDSPPASLLLSSTHLFLLVSHHSLPSSARTPPHESILLFHPPSSRIVIVSLLYSGISNSPAGSDHSSTASRLLQDSAVDDTFYVLLVDYVTGIASIRLQCSCSPAAYREAAGLRPRQCRTSHRSHLLPYPPPPTPPVCVKPSHSYSVFY